MKEKAAIFMEGFVFYWFLFYKKRWEKNRKKLY